VNVESHFARKLCRQNITFPNFERNFRISTLAILVVFDHHLVPKWETNAADMLRIIINLMYSSNLNSACHSSVEISYIHLKYLFLNCPRDTLLYKKQPKNDGPCINNNQYAAIYVTTRSNNGTMHEWRD